MQAMGLGMWQPPGPARGDRSLIVLWTGRKTGCTRAKGSTKGLGMVRKLPEPALKGPGDCRGPGKPKVGTGGHYLRRLSQNWDFDILWPGLPL